MFSSILLSFLVITASKHCVSCFVYKNIIRYNKSLQFLSFPLQFLYVKNVWSLLFLQTCLVDTKTIIHHSICGLCGHSPGFFTIQSTITLVNSSDFLPQYTRVSIQSPCCVILIQYITSCSMDKLHFIYMDTEQSRDEAFHLPLAYPLV